MKHEVHIKFAKSHNQNLKMLIEPLKFKDFR